MHYLWNCKGVKAGGLLGIKVIVTGINRAHPAHPGSHHDAKSLPFVFPDFDAAGRHGLASSKQAKLGEAVEQIKLLSGKIVGRSVAWNLSADLDAQG